MGVLCWRAVADNRNLWNVAAVYIFVDFLTVEQFDALWPPHLYRRNIYDM